MFKRIWILAIVILAAAGAALSAPEAKRELDPTELAKGKVARQVFDQIIARYRNGEGYDVDDLALWSQRILVADLAASADGAQRRTAYEAHQARTSDIEKIAVPISGQAWAGSPMRLRPNTIVSMQNRKLPVSNARS